MMNYRLLGKSELRASEIGFGCMSIDLNAEGNDRLIHQAIDYGINYFDTADLYDFGENERFIGKVIKSHRQQILIATKIGNEWKEGQSGWSWNASKNYLIRAAENSLKRLNTDHIDLLQLHGGTIEDDFDEIIEAFELLRQQGKIRHYGTSSIRPNVIRRFAAHGGSISNMMQYSLLDRRPEESSIEELKKAGISLTARGVLAKGLLAGKAVDSYLNLSSEEVKKILFHLSEFGSVQTLAQKYVLDEPATASLILGIRTMEQLNVAVKAYQEGQSIEIDREEIKDFLPAQTYEAHR